MDRHTVESEQIVQTCAPVRSGHVHLSCKVFEPPERQRLPGKAREFLEEAAIALS